MLHDASLFSGQKISRLFLASIWLQLQSSERLDHHEVPMTKADLIYRSQWQVSPFQEISIRMRSERGIHLPRQTTSPTLHSDEGHSIALLFFNGISIICCNIKTMCSFTHQAHSINSITSRQGTLTKNHDRQSFSCSSISILLSPQKGSNTMRYQWTIFIFLLIASLRAHSFSLLRRKLQDEVTTTFTTL